MKLTEKEKIVLKFIIDEIENGQNGYDQTVFDYLVEELDESEELPGCDFECIGNTLKSVIEKLKTIVKE